MLMGYMKTIELAKVLFLAVFIIVVDVIHEIIIVFYL